MFEAGLHDTKMNIINQGWIMGGGGSAPHVQLDVQPQSTLCSHMINVLPKLGMPFVSSDISTDLTV